MTHRLLVAGISGVIVGAGLLLPFEMSDLTEVFPPAREDDEWEPVRILFVGDIMLGRNVESLMYEHGADYPFEHVKETLSSPTLTVGNFEGIVSDPHEHAPGMTFRFSIRDEYLAKLREVGFDVLSLANNHSFDYGEKALALTRERCQMHGILCGGTPLGLDAYSPLLIEAGEETIGFMFLHDVWSDLDHDAAAEAAKGLGAWSTFQVAFIHWGVEYELSHSERQERLAHRLIDEGVDVVIGHHPHVIQDIEIYRGKPIFYSLGNFIFDQYFDAEVKKGLGVLLSLHPKEAEYELLGWASEERSKPRAMTEEEAVPLFSRLLPGRISSEHIDTLNTLKFIRD